MNKIDKQLDKGSPSLGEVVETSSPIVPGPHSRPIASEAATVRSMGPRLEQETSLQVVSSKTTSRRAWLRRGVAVASPVVATLASAPVYGACVNLNPSGFVSASTFASRHPGETVCAFLGPNFWIKDPSVMLGGAMAKVTFQSVFGKKVEAAIVSAKSNPTLFEVLNGKYSDLAKDSIAAYLNASKPTADFPLNAQQAVDVYTSYYFGPVKTPPLVQGWTELDTVNWLAMLMSRSS